MEFKVASLFAGVGGICLGFKNATFADNSYKMVWANEIDEYAVETYKTNFNHAMIDGDIEKILQPDREEDEEKREVYYQKREQLLHHKIDVLTAGFPCQAFSIAGYRKGFDDERGNLFLSIIDLIQQLGQRHDKPKMLFLENVKNLKSHDKGRTYRVIKEKLEEEGYTVKEAVLNTKEYTRLPQNRERIYIIAFRDSKEAENFLMFNHLEDYKVERNDEKRIEDIKSVLDLHLSESVAGKYYYTKEKYPDYFLTETEYKNIDEEIRKEHRINIDEEITEEYEFYQVRRGMYVRKNMNGVCPTLTANMGTGGHNVALIKVKDGVRKLTPAETFKLQGFPVGNGYKLPETYKGRPFSDGRLYKQAGNAVSVDVAQLIATEMLKAVEAAKQPQDDKSELVPN
ncbi:DNA (cytosine-5-)-methyltransferase [Alkalihalobacterium chitinilyticum]|uniref:Cytosine-specific methyltransferase n=1 Tax=Alkalihalobacterium chitinilyticum TaxID=2980103 RepID=A0ABT5VFJ4_9BACI|nr:DNA (cytosine-5-)-methyltransferase [Alkalihalobacterium chitinilyticum]MDE5414233.1 DNA (cytosine-5-)-methyltransferase [Alkalihalobacterium chitinilyticum]